MNHLCRVPTMSQRPHNNWICQAHCSLILKAAQRSKAALPWSHHQYKYLLPVVLLPPKGRDKHLLQELLRAPSNWSSCFKALVVHTSARWINANHFLTAPPQKLPIPLSLNCKVLDNACEVLCGRALLVSLTVSPASSPLLTLLTLLTLLWRHWLSFTSLNTQNSFHTPALKLTVPSAWTSGRSPDSKLLHTIHLELLWPRQLSGLLVSRL